MLFSGLLFIFQFMPIFFIAYYLTPKRYRNLILFIASLFFYAWGEPGYVILIFVSIFINYIAGLFLEYYVNKEKIRKLILILAIIYNVGSLLFFKYFNFIIHNMNLIIHREMNPLNIALPLGISFYTFQIMSYTIDVYRRDTKAEKSFINLGAYLCMFPQLIAGPIVVYTQVAKSLKKRHYDIKNIEQGLKIFVLGLGSKVLIANIYPDQSQNSGEDGILPLVGGFENICTFL